MEAVHEPQRQVQDESRNGRWQGMVMTEPIFRREIKSFVLRGGRLTDGQRKALATLAPQFVLPYSPQPLDLSQAFGRSGPTVLEIGIGMGEATAHIAALMTEKNFLCWVVHEPGVGALLLRI